MLRDIASTRWQTPAGPGKFQNIASRLALGIERGHQCRILLNANLTVDDGQINLAVPVGISDSVVLGACIFKPNVDANLVRPELTEYGLGDDSKKHDVRASHVENNVGSHQTLAVPLDVQAAVDNRRESSWQAVPGSLMTCLPHPGPRPQSPRPRRSGGGWQPHGFLLNHGSSLVPEVLTSPNLRLTRQELAPARAQKDTTITYPDANSTTRGLKLQWVCLRTGEPSDRQTPAQALDQRHRPQAGAISR